MDVDHVAAGEHFVVGVAACGKQRRQVDLTPHALPSRTPMRTMVSAPEAAMLLAVASMSERRVEGFERVAAGRLDLAEHRDLVKRGSARAVMLTRGLSIEAAFAQLAGNGLLGLGDGLAAVDAADEREGDGAVFGDAGLGGGGPGSGTR